MHNGCISLERRLSSIDGRKAAAEAARSDVRCHNRHDSRRRRRRPVASQIDARDRLAETLIRQVGRGRRRRRLCDSS